MTRKPHPAGRIRFDVASEASSQAYLAGVIAGRLWASDRSNSMGDRLFIDDEYAAGCAAGAGDWLVAHGTARQKVIEGSPEMLREVHDRR